MLIKGEDAGGLSLEEGKSTEQVRFFSKELCGADFNEGAVTMVEFGSRPVKRARLLSDTNDPVKEVQVSSFDNSGLTQGDLLEESNGNVGGMSQTRQGDGPVSESNSVVTNGFRTRNAEMKVVGAIYANEHLQNGVNTKTISKQKPGAENIHRNAERKTHLMLEDADDTTITSGDEGLFVIQARTPTIKQLRHGDELHSCYGEAGSKTAELHDSPHNPDILVHGHEDGRIVGCYPHISFEVEDLQNRKLDAEKLESSVPLANVEFVAADNSRHSDDRFVKIKSPNLIGKDVNGIIDDQLDGLPRRRRDTQYTERADANEHHNNGSIDGSNQMYSGLSRIAIKEVETTDKEGLVTEQVEHSTPQVLEFVSSHMENSAKVIQEASAVGLSDTRLEEEAGVNSSEVLNVYVRKRKRSTPADIETTVDSVPLKEYDSSQLEDVEGERVIKHYVRRPHRQVDSHSPADMTQILSVTTSSSNAGKEAVNSPLAEHHTDVSVRVESEGKINVFQRRSKMNQMSRAESHADVSPSKTDVPRVDSEGNLNVFHRRSKMNQLHGAEHHAEISDRVESEGNLNVFQRRSRVNHSTQAEHRADVSTPKADVARVESESEGNLHVFQRRSKKNQLPEAEQHIDTSARVEIEGTSNVFQRRSKMNHMSEHHGDVFQPKVESEGTLNVFQRRTKKNQLPKARHHADVCARVETEGKLNVFQRRSKKNLSQKEVGNESEKQGGKKSSRVTQLSSRNGIIGVQNEVTENTPGYVRADHQPNWLPEGWTLEIREGKTTAYPRDKYYHHNKSGRIFRSKYEVLQFLGDGRVGGIQMMSDGSVMKSQTQTKKKPPVSIAPAKQAELPHPLSKPSISTQTGLISQAAPSPSPFTHVHPACMKTTPMRPTSAAYSEGNETVLGWTHSTGPNGPIWPQWVGAIGTGRNNTDKQCQTGTPGKDAGASSSQLLSSADGIQFPTASPVSTVKSPSDQGDKDNRGKLIFRLKRKQPDSVWGSHIDQREVECPPKSLLPHVASSGELSAEGGKGRSKRPMYEVVHGEKASSSTSTQTNQEKLTIGERTGQDVPPTPTSVHMHLQGISSVKEFLIPNVPNIVSCPMPLKAQVEKPSFTSPSPLVMITVDRTSDQSVAPSFKVTSFEAPRGVPDSISMEHSTMPNWGIKHNPLQNPSPHLELLQQEPYTALGIPAQARYSGLQQMASYSANHTHVFLDPVDNTIPLSWQHPFTSQTSAPVTALVPTRGPFPSAFGPSVTQTFSSTVPTPVFENFPAVSSVKNLNATSTVVPEPGVDSRLRDSTSNAKLTEGGPQVHKTVKAPKPLTKADHTKLFLGLGRRLCRTGVEQKTKKTRNPGSVGMSKPLLESQIPVTILEGKRPQQGARQAAPRMQ